MNAAHTAGLLGAFKDHPDEDCSSSVAYIRAVGAALHNSVLIVGWAVFEIVQGKRDNGLFTNRVCSR